MFTENTNKVLSLIEALCHEPLTEEKLKPLKVFARNAALEEAAKLVEEEGSNTSGSARVQALRLALLQMEVAQRQCVAYAPLCTLALQARLTLWAAMVSASQPENQQLGKVLQRIVEACAADYDNHQ